MLKAGKSLKAWFNDYFNWLTISAHGQKEQLRSNNHGTWYDVQYTAIALYLEKIDLAKSVFESAKTLRIESQIEPNGSMPLELERASSLHYSLYDVTAFFALATLADKVNIDLWNYKAKSGVSIKAVLDFTTPYITQPKKYNLGVMLGARAPRIFRFA